MKKVYFVYWLSGQNAEKWSGWFPSLRLARRFLSTVPGTYGIIRSIPCGFFEDVLSLDFPTAMIYSKPVK